MRRYLISLTAGSAALAAAASAAAQSGPEPLPHYGNSYAYDGAQPGPEPLPHYGNSYAYPPGSVPPEPLPHYGNSYAYDWDRDRYDLVRQLEARVVQLQAQINGFAFQHRLSRREAERLRSEALQLRMRINVAARDGLNPYEHNEIEQRIVRLNNHIYREARDGNRWRDDRRYHTWDGKRDGGVRSDRDDDRRYHTLDSGPSNGDQRSDRDD